ncbi:MAG TPA: glycosyltransferase family 9 protein [Terriglobales bacterium]|nr:glycosyltransferase family 9 protein [Terriglobales bacterium]
MSAARLVTPPESILVVRLGAMGDVIHTLAAVTALRSALPKLRIGWLVEERWSELLSAKESPRRGAPSAQRPLADFVHVVDTKRWRKSPIASETCKQIKSARHEIRNQKYAVAADFQGALKSAFMARLSGSSMVIGFEHPREAPATLLYHEKFAATGAHVIEQYRSLSEVIAGRALPDCAPLLPRDEQAETRMAAKLAAIGREFVLINPGAGWGAKEWPAERYGEVARALASLGLVPIINFGPGEQELATAVNHACGGEAELMSSSITELIALTRRARLFIGGDTGPLHLAAALHIPIVAIFGPTDPERNGPYGTNSIVLRNPSSRTSLSHTNVSDPGLLKITADEVISAAHKLVESSSA